MENLKFRDMTKEDLDFVFELSNKTKELWASERIKFPLDRKVMEVWIQYNEDDALFIAETDGKPVGFCVGSLDYNAAELLFMGVSEEHRRKGMGTRMLNEFMERMKSKGAEKFYLYVQTDNEAATKLYEKFGFEKGSIVFFMSKDWPSAE